MAGWFERFVPRAGAARPLAQRLRSYPPYDAPHAGPASRWTPAQARANLDHLLAVRPQRLAALGELLADYGIDIAPVLAGAEPKPLLAALHHWAFEFWPALRGAKMPERATWLASPRAGEQIVYALLLDLAILLGEIIIARRPSFRWGVDFDEENARDGMESQQRAVLLAPRRDDVPGPVLIDVEAIVVSRYRNIHSPTERVLDEWAALVQDAVSGACEGPASMRAP